MGLKNIRDFVSGQLLNAHQGLDPRQPGKTFHDPNRVFVQETGCYNCLHFNCDDLAAQHFERRVVEDKKVLQARGVSPVAIRRAIKNLTDMAKPPKSGLCMAGKGGADFVSATYHCEHWSGRIKPEGGVSDTPLEIRDRLGETVDKE